MKKLILLLLLTSCASHETLMVRDAVRDRCKTGDANACRLLPDIQARVDEEANENAKGVLAGILVGVAAGIADSQRPTYVFVRRCRFC